MEDMNIILVKLSLAALIFLVGAGAGYKFVHERFDKARVEHQALIKTLESRMEEAVIENKRLEKTYEDAFNVANEKYKDAIDRNNNDVDRMRKQRDSARKDAMSRIAESSEDSNRLCFSRDKFESAIRQFDDELSEIARKCDDIGEKLKTTKNWWDSIENSRLQ